MTEANLDFDSKYKVEGWGGIAWYALSYEKVQDEDYEWSGIEHENRDNVVCMMVGDDAKFTFEVSMLTTLDDDEYCHECGQIGCTANG